MTTPTKLEKLANLLGIIKHLDMLNHRGRKYIILTLFKELGTKDSADVIVHDQNVDVARSRLYVLLGKLMGQYRLAGDFIMFMSREHKERYKPKKGQNISQLLRAIKKNVVANTERLGDLFQ